MARTRKAARAFRTSAPGERKDVREMLIDMSGTACYLGCRRAATGHGRVGCIWRIFNIRHRSMRCLRPDAS